MKRFFALLFFLAAIQSHAAYDTLLTETARFIGGASCQTEKFISLQQKTYYKDHFDFTNGTWKILDDSTLTPMVNWAKEKNIIEVRDTGTCFYPFSGPDFLFAEKFFPGCKTYILLGLERLGTSPDILKMKEESLKEYLGAIRSSLRYLNKAGYFVTQHMSQDFSKTVLNGNIHILFYFLARSGHVIQQVDRGFIDGTGNFIVNSMNTKKNSNGLCITFSRENEIQEKKLYYFSIDVADYKLGADSGFEKFVRSFSLVNTYIKSASYILANKNFSVMRKIISDLSLKLLQDDTGMPLKEIDPKLFELQMWGTYTKTIKDLSWGYQPDLKEALQKSGNNYPLPFYISYNGNYGEGVMMFGRKK
ncbi:MAG: hypothetical protein ACOZCO_18140 [Bacteroidota bacterium]